MKKGFSNPFLKFAPQHSESDTIRGTSRSCVDTDELGLLRRKLKRYECRINKIIREVRSSPIAVVKMLHDIAPPNPRTKSKEDLDDDRWLLRLMFRSVNVDYDQVAGFVDD